MTNNAQMYGMQSAEHDSLKNMEAESIQHNQEDMIMQIPREGNADQLNKSTKLTLSSKKQYDNHM